MVCGIMENTSQPSKCALLKEAECVCMGRCVCVYQFSVLLFVHIKAVNCCSWQLLYYVRFEIQT